MNIPPGNTLFVVISRSLCECHMNAQARSLAGLACVLLGCRFEQLGVEVDVPAVPVTQPAEPEFATPGEARKVVSARSVASGPKYGLPLYQAPLAKILGFGKVAGP